jgi:small subunit ribosomal protein S14
MASKAKIEKARRTPKYTSRIEHRCNICGRPRAVYRKFKVCRICFRNLALDGLIPGARKASW